MTKINILCVIGFFLTMTSFAKADDQGAMQAISKADQLMLMQNYADAEQQYQSAMKMAESALSRAYAHYKLGTIYNDRNNRTLAKKHWNAGVAALRAEGQENSSLHFHLQEAIKDVSAGQ